MKVEKKKKDSPTPQTYFQSPEAPWASPLGALEDITSFLFRKLQVTAFMVLINREMLAISLFPSFFLSLFQRLPPLFLSPCFIMYHYTTDSLFTQNHSNSRNSRVCILLSVTIITNYCQQLKGKSCFCRRATNVMMSCYISSSSCFRPHLTAFCQLLLAFSFLNLSFVSMIFGVADGLSRFTFLECGGLKKQRTAALLFVNVTTTVMQQGLVFWCEL